MSKLKEGLIRGSNGRIYSLKKFKSIDELEQKIEREKLADLNKRRIKVKTVAKKVVKTKTIKGKKVKQISFDSQKIYVNNKGKKVSEKKYFEFINKLDSLAKKINPSNFKQVNSIIEDNYLDFLNYSILSEIAEEKSNGKIVYFKGKEINLSNYKEIIDYIRTYINKKSKKKDYPIFRAYYDIQANRTFIFEIKNEDAKNEITENNYDY